MPLSFCVIGDTIYFHSALEGLLSKYSAGFMEKGLRYIEKLSPEVRVFGVRIEHISGKARR